MNFIRNVIRLVYDWLHESNKRTDDVIRIGLGMAIVVVIPVG